MIMSADSRMQSNRFENESETSVNSGEEGEVLSLHARELRVLERIAEAGTQIASMEELIDHACHIVLDSFDFDLVGIGVPDEKEGLLKLRYAVRGLADRIQKFSLPLNRIMGRSDLKQRLLYGFKDNERDHYFLSSEANIQSSLNVPVEVQERVIGFIIAESLNCKRLNGTHERLLKNVANQLALAIDHSRTYDDTLEGWVRALDLRDKETEDHTRRVVESTLRMARRMGTREEDLVHVRRGALLHDIGKLGVPDHPLPSR